MGTDYVHGYTDSETRRLSDQADTLAELLHGGTQYAPGSRVLEVGCGVGAQTVQLLTRSPGIALTSVDISEDSLAEAKRRVVARAPYGQVEWHHGDLHNLPYAEFDHLFVCFVLEHLPDPVEALRTLRNHLRPGGTITVVEGDHGSAIYHPRSDEAQAVIECLNRSQADAGGDALIGRRVQPLLTAAGFTDVVTEPRTVYADQTVPHLVDGFTRRTFIAMVGSVRARSIATGLSTPDAWARGIRDLERAAEPGGTFHYTFFKGVGVR
ncbi:methyltransferase [Kribbella endophytica]